MIRMFYVFRRILYSVILEELISFELLSFPHQKLIPVLQVVVFLSSTNLFIRPARQ